MLRLRGLRLDQRLQLKSVLTHVSRESDPGVRGFAVRCHASLNLSGTDQERMQRDGTSRFRPVSAGLPCSVRIVEWLITEHPADRPGSLLWVAGRLFDASQGWLPLDGDSPGERAFVPFGDFDMAILAPKGDVVALLDSEEAGRAR